MTKRKTKKKNILIIAICAVLVIGGIVAAIALGGKDKADKPKQNNKKPEPVEEKKVQIVDVNSKSRPFAVMINNIAVARPLHSGLQDAYIIYEMIVEGGITRYMALFLDQNTERIGSIRSSRHYYLDYALENDAIYVHHGQSTQAQADFKKGLVDRIVVDNGKTGWRDTSLKYSREHTLFTSIAKLKNGIGNKRTERKNDLLLDYSVDPRGRGIMPKAKEAKEVKIKYSSSTTSSYKYDEENKVYNRFVNGKEHKDYVTKKQYTFKNIITYQVHNYNLNDGSGKGRQGLDNIGKGTGWYISEGYAVPITWEKKDRASQTIYKFEDGTDLKVNDGNTFIQIQPKGEPLTIS